MFILLYIFLFLASSPVRAQELIFQDDFNRQQLDKWQVVRNRQWEQPELPCMNGNSAAEWELKDGELGIVISAGAGCTTTIVPTELDLTDVGGIQLEFEWRFPESTHMDRNMAILWQDADNWYGLKTLDDKIFIEKVVNGQEQWLLDSSSHYDFSPDESYHFQLTWLANQKILVKINDELIISAQDRLPYISGFKTAGLMASTGAIRRSVSFFDNFTVRSLLKPGEKQLGVPLIKQHDPEWKNHEYDSAQDWAQKSTIARWGCALTSATMILNYYGIDQIPDGRSMTPAKLNAWLNDQADGYIGQGLVNWLAITRLTNIMSPILNTPVLEYQYVGGDEISTSIDQIDHQQPIVLQLPGHFLVADGYTADKSDLWLKDPAYDYDLLSQHQQRLLSTRTFTPSHTDLSYLLIVYPPSVEVKVLDENDSPPTALETAAEYIQDPESEYQVSTEVKLIQSLAKPSGEKYQLIIDNFDDEQQQVEIYAYDINGEVTSFSQSITGLKIFELDFNSIDQSQLEEITNQFTLLRAQLKIWYERRDITVKYAYLKLDQLAAYAEVDEDNHERYVELILKTAQELEEFIPYSSVILTLAPSS